MPGPETPWETASAEEVGLEGAAWNRSVLEAETGTMFHAWEWVAAVARAFRRRPRHYALLDRKGAVKALFPVQEGRSGPFRTAYSPVTIVTPYGGPACARADIPTAFRAIRVLQRKKGWHYLRMAPSPAAWSFGREFEGYEVLPGSTRVVALGSDAAMRRALNRRCRRYIEKADEAGVTIRDIKDFDFLDTYLSWGEKAFERVGQEFPTPRAIYEALRRHVLPTGSLLVRGAFVADRPVTVEWFGLSGGTLYAIDSAMDREAGVAGAGNKLTWETMRLAAEKGATQFDILGTNIPAISEYKQSFGGELVPAHNLESATRAFLLARKAIGKTRRRA